MTLTGPVFVGTDLTSRSAEALRQAHRLAETLSASLIVCHILPEFPRVRILFPQFSGTDAEVREALLAKAREAVEHEVAQMPGIDRVRWRLVFDMGSPHSGLLAQAEASRAGLIVTGPGPVADRVVRHATVPVLVAGPSPRGDVIGATDFSDPSLPALETAASEARRRQSRLHLVHVVDLGVHALAGIGGGISYLTPPALQAIEELRADAQERLEYKLASLAVDGQAVAVSGPTVTMILDLAESSRAELIVVGTHGRSGFARLTLGSTAESVVRSAPCSVLVVRLASA
ncbi:MAG: universal stress protein [Vicinamibacterales bacterium]